MQLAMTTMHAYHVSSAKDDLPDVWRVSETLLQGILTCWVCRLMVMIDDIVELSTLTHQDIEEGVSLDACLNG